MYKLNGWLSVLLFIYFFQLLSELKQVRFTLDNQTFHFNTSGNFVNGYHLMNWAQNKSSGQREFVVVGGYKLEQEQINIEKYIQWYNSNSNMVSIYSNLEIQIYIWI